MVLNYIWIGFFVVAAVVAVVRSATGDVEVWQRMMGATFEQARNGFEISLWLTGVLALWLGLMKCGERGGVIGAMSRMVSPLFTRLFPGVPKDHPAMGSMFMNMSANMLGLDNAATPMGLKAMQELQSLNPDKSRATDAMIMFLVMNASGLCLIPISIMMYRAQGGAQDPTDVFLPILLATCTATLTGIVALCLRQRISLRDPVLLAWLGGIGAVVAGIVYLGMSLDGAMLSLWSGVIANVLLFGTILTFLLAAALKRVNVYEAFIEGARDGFKTAVGIIPYLVAILVGIGVMRASGAMEMITDAIAWLLSAVGLEVDWIEALPTAVMKPMSGSGSRAMMVELQQTYGVDSLVARVSASIQGSTDTMFYVLAVYFGSVGIRRTRYAVSYALLADVTGSIAGIAAACLFFG